MEDELIENTHPEVSQISRQNYIMFRICLENA
jgi:hypothetical protein